MSKKEIEYMKNLLKTQNFSINSEELADAIVKAQEKAENNRTQKIQADKEAAVKRWQNTIGLREDKPLSYVTAFFKLLCLKKKDVDGDRVTTTLLMFIAKGIMQFVMFGMFSITILSIVGIFIAEKYIGGNVILVKIELVALAFICFTFGNLFRISSYEIEKIDNKDYLNTILTSVLTILGTIIAIISLAKGK